MKLRTLALMIVACSITACSATPSSESAASTGQAKQASGDWQSCAIGGGQCLVAVQNYFARYGITVGIAGGYGEYDDQGRYCAAYGACLIWVDDVPSSYGWVRTDSPDTYDIAVFPPHPGNEYGHITIVDHVDASGVWMVDSNDNLDERPNNTPHLHSATPYGYYHYTGDLGALASCRIGDDGNGGGGSSAGGSGADTSGANCAGYYDGLYCGSDYVDGDPNTLYECSGGTASVADVCANGCQIQNDGTNDGCY
ncbi:MAG: CHAP domain-containing protein [Polyangiaceae bacterium]